MSGRGGRRQRFPSVIFFAIRNITTISKTIAAIIATVTATLPVPSVIRPSSDVSVPALPEDAGALYVPSPFVTSGEVSADVEGAVSPGVSGGVPRALFELTEPCAAHSAVNMTEIRTTDKSLQIFFI